MESLRLNRFLATAGVASRRRCDDLIRSGRVSVNGQRVTELGTRVEPGRDEVAVDETGVSLPDGRRILAMNKPREVLVAAHDARGRRTVMDLLPEEPVRVYPVGRLDYRSEGLLLFTNDGDLAYRLAHPRFKVEKTYRVVVAGKVRSQVVAALREGVLLEDGPTLPANVTVIQSHRDTTELEIELREGRKRQIRRMLALFGHDVVRLLRVRFGPLDLGTLTEGESRALTPNEERALRRAVGLGEGDAS